MDDANFGQTGIGYNQVFAALGNRHPMKSIGAVVDELQRDSFIKALILGVDVEFASDVLQLSEITRFCQTQKSVWLLITN